MALSMDAASLESAFPSLAGTQYQITSNRSVHYNCIAWAASRNDAWWWPDPMGRGFWPDGVARVATIDSFVQAFATLGYIRGQSDAVDPDEEKVALFAKGDTPLHAARQLSNGKWTSKLGKSYDIEHELQAIAGDQYGRVACILRRSRLPQS